MRTRLIHLLILLCTSLCLAPPSAASGTAPRISDISHYRSSDGLGSERVYSIVQSPDGAIWFGTRRGIDRYNGSRFKHYDINQGLKAPDYAGRAIKLLLTPDKSICAYDNQGRIFIYDPGHDRFNPLLQLRNHVKGDIILTSLAAMPQGSMLAGTFSGLYLIRPNNKVSTLLPDTHVNGIATHGSRIFAATATGLAVIEGHRMRRLLPGMNLETIYFDTPSSTLYIGSADAGLWRLTPGSNTPSRLDAGNKLLEHPIRAIERLDNRYIAIGIDGGGVCLYDTRTATAQLLIDADDTNRFYLNGNGIYTLATDRDGTLWTGSYAGGASALHFRHSAVTPIVHEKGNHNSVRNNNINSIAQSSDGSLWFGTDHGMSIMHAATGSWSHPAPTGAILTLHPTPDGGMLAGTYDNGIYRLDPSGRVTANLTHQNGALSSNSIFAIKRSPSGEYWVASLNGGVMRLDPSLKLLRTYPVNVAFSIANTPDGHIAVGTANGYHVIDPATHSITHYAGSSEFKGGVNSYIISMFYSSPHTVWLGTEGGGIYVYDQQQRRILRNYTTAQGLPSNDVYSILRDPRGNIVVSTGSGLALMQQGRFKSLNFHRAGLDKEFNKSAGTILANGDMVFGSVNGAEVVRPSHLTGGNFSAPVRITGITVPGTDGKASTDTDTIVAHLYGSERRIPLEHNRARLKYGDNSFTIHFEAINLLYQNDIAYQYMLEGYDRAWSPASAQASAEYKNVAAGSYTFRVRSVRTSNGAVLNEVAMPLTVASPWWGSWWAWMIYILIAAAVLAFIYSYSWLKLRERHDKDKIRFFINTAHDIRTPVSLVMAPVNDLRRDPSLSDSARRLVDTASANIAKLYSVTSQLLEFERFDSGRSPINLQPVNLNTLLSMETECFRDACQRKNIELSLHLPPQELCITGDRYLLEMLLDNLLSNACKYTPAGGRITVTLTAERRKVRISIGDNGIGIPTRERRKVLNEVYRARNARQTNEGGTGFGLLQARRITALLRGTFRLDSAEGIGTTVTLCFRRIDAAGESVAEKLTHTFVDTGLTQPPHPASLPDTAAAPTDDADPRHTLLVVEDNDELRTYLADMFAGTYTVHTAANAAEALEYLSANYPDLILSDVMMPGIQGDELCRRIKQDAATAGIPVVLLTAKADHHSVMEGLQCGADDYLQKPFNSDILRLKIQGILANRDRLRHHLLNRAIELATDIVPIPEQQPVSEPHPQPADPPTSPASQPEPTTSPTTQPDPMPTALSEAEPAPDSADARFVTRATDTVLRHMADPEFDIDQLCREMAMSRTLLYTRLKALTGQTPQDFIRMLRLERAAECLRRHTPVAEVAEQCGFVNVKYFSTLFKKHFGVQPSRFAAQD